MRCPIGQTPISIATISYTGFAHSIGGPERRLPSKNSDVCSHGSLLDDTAPAFGDEFIVHLDDGSIDFLDEMGSQTARQALPGRGTVPPQYRRQGRDVADWKQIAPILLDQLTASVGSRSDNGQSRIEGLQHDQRQGFAA